jgi:hypothetical protein
VDGTSHTQTFSVRMDPRVKTPGAGLEQQYALSLALYDAMWESAGKASQARGLRLQLADRKSKAPGAAAAVDALDQKLAELAGPDRTAAGAGFGGGGGGRGAGGSPTPQSFGLMTSELMPSMTILQSGDDTPTTQAVAAANARLQAFAALEAKWNAIVRTDVPGLNAKLKAAGVDAVTIPAPSVDVRPGPPPAGSADPAAGER